MPRRVPPVVRLVPLVLLCAAAGCGAASGGRGAGSGAAAAAGIPAGPPGARVVVSDPATTPGALLSPFPDDRFTVLDPTSPTGRRLALPIPAATALAQVFETELARIDGFGIMAPITVTFEDDLDLASVTDDSVLVVNAEPGSPRMGERVPLDLGRGSYRTDIGPRTRFYARDPLAAVADIVYPPGNPGPHYEAASHTLVLRPLRPLEEGALYVVVLTSDLRDAHGGIVSPPAGFSRPTSHDAALAIALGPRGTGAIRYQWAFTTGTPTLELRAVADALDGVGPLAAALAAAPPAMDHVDDLGTPFFDGSPYTLDGGPITEALGAVARLARLAAPLSAEAAEVAALLDLVDPSSIGYLAFGEIRAPDLRASTRGTWLVDLATGSAPARPGLVPFLLVCPRPTADNGYAQPPYPVLISGHGNGRSKIDGLGIAGQATRHGWAVLALDEVGHGPDDALVRLPALVAGAARKDPAVDVAARAVVLGLALLFQTAVNPFDPLEDQLGQVLCGGPLHPLFCEGRAVDVDGDGYTDSGATFFTANVFQTRDILRQSVADMMSLARVFESLGVDRNGNGRLDPEEGDFDRDGRLDVGGFGRRIAYTGISLGGILGAVLCGADPAVARAALMVPGGGLTDIVVNSSLEDVTRRVFRQVFAAVIVGSPTAAGGGANVEIDGAGGVGAVATDPGGLVTAENQRLGVVAAAVTAADGGFRLHLEADPGDPFEVQTWDRGGAPLGTLHFRTPAGGLGLERATPRLREWTGLAALALEPGDPASYAPRWRDAGARRAITDVLVQVSLGDTTVPTMTGATLGRSAGIVSLARNDLLVAQGVTAGGLANVDRIFGVESTRTTGIRFLGVHAHAGMLVPDPNQLPASALYATAAERQALGFISTGFIDDADPIFDTVLP